MVWAKDKPKPKCKAEVKGWLKPEILDKVPSLFFQVEIFQDDKLITRHTKGVFNPKPIAFQAAEPGSYKACIYYCGWLKKTVGPRWMAATETITLKFDDPPMNIDGL